MLRITLGFLLGIILITVGICGYAFWQFDGFVAFFIGAAGTLIAAEAVRL